jgi:multiple RNA-binding domain-containing protein 1
MEEVSRIFVRNLPPTITEAEFRKFFSRGQITDVKLIQQRRIGYVGYKTPEEARQAVKHFNRSFIRMSKISVELAKPVS